MGLITSAINNWTGEYHLRSFDGYCDEYKGVSIKIGDYPAGSSHHSTRPYQFKPMMIREAYEMGYRQVLWMDSTCRVMKDPSPLWPLVKKRGILAWDNLGHPLTNWINQRALDNMGVDRGSIASAKQIMACCIMFDFTNPVAVKILNDWCRRSDDGTFSDDKQGSPHRHDQAVLSLLMHIHNIPLNDYGDGFCYGEQLSRCENVFLINKGI